MSKKLAAKYGVFEATKNRYTGTVVLLSTATDEALDPCGGEWLTICKTHGTICNHTTRKLAKGFLSAPWSWCEACQDIVYDENGEWRGKSKAPKRGDTVKVLVELDRIKHCRTFRPKVGTLGTVVELSQGSPEGTLYAVAFATPIVDAGGGLWPLDIDDMGDIDRSYLRTLFLGEELEVVDAA
jgi:hypothetical protein